MYVSHLLQNEKQLHLIQTSVEMWSFFFFLIGNLHTTFSGQKKIIKKETVSTH